MVRLDRASRRHARQVTEHVIRQTGVRSAFVTSWDAYHLDLLGGFAPRSCRRPTQFELAGSGFREDYGDLLDAGRLRVARLDGRAPALEAAGFTCVGTVFRLTLDPDRFGADRAAYGRSALHCPGQPDRLADGIGVAVELGVDLLVRLPARRHPERLGVGVDQALAILEVDPHQDGAGLVLAHHQPVVDVPGDATWWP